MFDPKDTQEAITLTFDYSAAGATVSNPVSVPAVSVRLVKGIDPNPSAILSGSPQVLEGDKVLQRIIGGVSGCLYQIRCFANVGSDRPLIEDTLPVHAPCASN